MPKASAREFHQKHSVVRYRKALQASRAGRPGGVRVATGGLAPTAFGANPVASALGNRIGRDPDAAERTYHGWSRRPLKTGTFYFAGKRNFLLCLDIIVLAEHDLSQLVIRLHHQSSRLRAHDTDGAEPSVVVVS